MVSIPCQRFSKNIHLKADPYTCFCPLYLLCYSYLALYLYVLGKITRQHQENATTLRRPAFPVICATLQIFIIILNDTCFDSLSSLLISMESRQSPQNQETIDNCQQQQNSAFKSYSKRVCPALLKLVQAKERTATKWKRKLHRQVYTLHCEELIEGKKYTSLPEAKLRCLPY